MRTRVHFSVRIGVTVIALTWFTSASTAYSPACVGIKVRTPRQWSNVTRLLCYAPNESRRCTFLPCGGRGRGPSFLGNKTAAVLVAAMRMTFYVCQVMAGTYRVKACQTIRRSFSPTWSPHLRYWMRLSARIPEIAPGAQVLGAFLSRYGVSHDLCSRATAFLTKVKCFFKEDGVAPK